MGEVESENGVPDGPLMNKDGKVNMPTGMLHGQCGREMFNASKCIEEKGKEAKECEGPQREAHMCIVESMYNYVSLRRMCKREYDVWAKCMNTAGADNLSHEDAEHKCASYSEPLSKCGEELAQPTALAAMSRGMPLKDIPEQK